VLATDSVSQAGAETFKIHRSRKWRNGRISGPDGRNAYPRFGTFRLS
jgi:hypothetical protein